MTSLLICTIPGTPQQQGSKTRTPQGSTREANRNLAPWRDQPCHADVLLELANAEVLP